MSRKIPNEELNRLSAEAFKDAEKTPIIVVLDNIRSLNNIGSVFRTSDAFLIEKIYLCGITAQPPHRDIRKTALGSTETVDWEYAESTLELVKKLQADGTEVYAVEQVEGSIMLNDFQPNKSVQTVLVLGNEVDGVQQEVVNQCNGSIEIPQLGTKHSLNISVSAGVVIWDVFEKLHF
ncbi:MAG: 23S rRNA (guanosine2251-2'-O)-methyltransferase [Chitinophagales bacterium]|jgi:23S rRNA (guanosine2251-2'-O)-methyltransferase